MQNVSVFYVEDCDSKFKQQSPKRFESLGSCIAQSLYRIHIHV